MTQTSRKSLQALSWAMALVIGIGGMVAAHQKAKHDAALKVFAASQARQLAEAKAKLVEEKLLHHQTEDEALAAIRESADHGFMALDQDNRITRWNPALEKWTGYNADKMLGQTLEKVMEPADYANHAKNYPGWIADEESTKKTLKLDCRLITRNGKRISVSVAARKVWAEGGGPPYAIALVDRPRNVLDLTNGKP